MAAGLALGSDWLPGKLREMENEMLLCIILHYIVQC